MKKLLFADAVLAVLLASCAGGAGGKPKVGVDIRKYLAKR